MRAATILFAALLLPGPLAAQGAPKAGAKAKPTPAAKKKPVAEPARPSIPEPAPIATLPQSAPRVTLAQALATTLERDPNVERAHQEVRRLQGLVQETSGRFDPILTWEPKIERDKTSLTESALKGEVSKREFLRDSQENLGRIATEIASGLTDPNGRPFPDCKGSQYFINGMPICTDKVSETDYRTFQMLQDAQDATSGHASTTDKLTQAINEANRRRLTTILFLLRRVFLPALGAQLAALGELPRESETDTFTFDLRLLQPFRNGMTLGPVVFLQGVRYAFSDKPDSPAYGGTGVPTLYRAVLGLAFDAPLLRGAGTGSADAEERSARLQYEAARESWIQAASDALLNTTIAYWNLAGAQELEKLLVRSASEQRRIGELSRALVKGDELPRSELSKADAQAADAEASALQAVRTREAYRVELARAMGLDVARIEEAPLAADPLPPAADVPVPDARGTDDLVHALPDARGDVRSAWKRVEAAKVLEEAARRDLKPRLDLTIQGGWNAIWEDPTFAIVKAWNPTGYWRALGDTYVGPSFEIKLAFQLPWGNNAQKGRLVSAQAFTESQLVTAKDLERQAANETRIVARTLPSSVREVAARETAAAEAEKSVGVAYERFRAGETTLLDAILTERQRAQTLADLVGARQILAQRAARLRWTAGTLLPVTRDKGEIRFGVPGS